MRILIACDSFKGSLSAKDACQRIAQGLRQTPVRFELDECPMADGGEGMLAAFAAAQPVRVESVEVSDPLGYPCSAEIGWLASNECADAIETLLGGIDGFQSSNCDKIALLEAASCIGLTKVPKDRRDPLVTSSYGLGQLLLHAIRAEATAIVVGLGGTSTVDAGLGLAQAMGVRFEGIPARSGGAALSRVTSVDLSTMQAWQRSCRIILASDVSNPLLGPRGAARAFGPQKGASTAVVEQLELSIGRYARCLFDACAARQARDPRKESRRLASGLAGAPPDFQSAITQPGTGAAGGLGFALQQLFDANYQSGVELTMRAVNFDERLRISDLVITGEGRLDLSSFEGKVVSGVLSRARPRGIPVYAVVGSNACDGETLRAEGLIHVETLLTQAASLDDAKDRASDILTDCGARLGRMALQTL